MLVADQSPAKDTDLERAIRRQIVERTYGRVHYLEIEVQDGQVRVQGVAPTYYVKQLALTAVREVSESAPVVLAIEVAPGHRTRTPD